MNHFEIEQSNMNNRKLLVAALCAASITFSACNKKQETQTNEEIVPAINLADMDTLVRPQDDFYHYVNGGWIKANPLKPAYSRFGTFDVLRDRSLEQIHGIVDELAQGSYKAGTNEYRVSVLYKQAIDSVKRNELGAQPILDELKAIEAIDSREALVDFAAQQDNKGDATFFGTYVMADAENSDMNIFNLNQTGLALGNKEYYTDPKNAEIIKAYNQYIERIAQLAGYSAEDAQRIAKNNIAISNVLADMCYSQTELRDVERNFNKVEVKQFVADNPGFDWARYIEGRNLQNLESWNGGQLDFFKKFSKWFPTADLQALKDYLLAQTIDGYASYLSDDFVQASFDFYSTTLSGVKEMHPRWRRAVNLLNGTLGEALGEVYVKKYFPAEAKERMETMISNLQAALKDRISQLEWMSGDTKQKAIEKLSNFTVKIGYPDKWKDYSKLNISEDNSFVENLRCAIQFEHDFNMSELGQPVDRSRWLMNPQDVNAYYMPTTNEICFPAGILQPPFFNINADDAVNYGAIGVVIGHEMTHGFDDQGSAFDAVGNMNNWWTDADKNNFKTSTERLAQQFSQIKINDNLNADGHLTLGENIADQGGLLVSYLALQKQLEGKTVEKIDGFTPAQRFFIGYARVWGQNITPEEEVRLTKIDPHSLGINRVNQALKNVDAFYEAFNVQPGDPMYIAPEERVVVW